MFKNMKIPVENNLNEIVAELEKQGYKTKWELNDYSKIICTFSDGIYVDYLDEKTDDSFILTTLAELKRM